MSTTGPGVSPATPSVVPPATVPATPSGTVPATPSGTVPTTPALRQKPPLTDRDRMPRWVPRAIGLLMASVVGLALIYWLAFRLRSFFVVILVSLFLSFALEPAVNWLAERGWRRGLATAAAFLVTTMLFLLFVLAMAQVLADQIRTLIDSAPEYIETTADWLDEQFGIEINTDDLISQFTQDDGAISTVAGRLAGDLVGLGSTVVGLVIQGLTVALLTFYLVADGPRLRRLICSTLSPERQTMVLRGWEIAIAKTGGYIYSRALLAVAAFLFHWVVFAAIGVPYPLPLAMWVGVVSQLIPVVGTYLAGLVPGLIALIDDPISAIWVVGAVIIYQQVENYLISPRIVSRTVNIHPAVSFSAVIIGAALLGTVGALLAVPATATIQAFVSTYIKRHELIDSELLKRRDDLADGDLADGEIADGDVAGGPGAGPPDD